MAKKAPIEENKPDETIIPDPITDIVDDRETPLSKKPIQLIPPTPEPERKPQDPINQLNTLDIEKEVKKQLEPFQKLLTPEKTTEPTPQPKSKDLGFLSDLEELF